MRGGEADVQKSPTRMQRRQVCDWPEPERQLWETPQGNPYAAQLHYETLWGVKNAYEIWLGWLISQGPLEAVKQPLDRASPDRIRNFITTMRKHGWTRATIRTRLSRLRTAFKVMQPGCDAAWISLGGIPSAPRASGRNQTYWPETDRSLWQAAFSPGDDLDDPKYALSLSEVTINTTIKVYGRWLNFLRAENRLDEAALPSSRATRSNVQAYFTARRTAGNASATIISCLEGLQVALRIMQPDFDTRWITHPGGVSIASLLPNDQRPIEPIHPLVLYRWGQRLMQEYLEAPLLNQRTKFRNGLIIAFLAARAPRRGSMEKMQVGLNLVPYNEGYRVIFREDDTKNERPIEYDMPAGLTSSIKRYLEIERPALLNGRDHDWLWVDRTGARLSRDGISDCVRRLSLAEFGRSYTPHRFRHSIATYGPLVDPAHPGVAAAVLGITAEVVENHYNRANRAEAARHHNEVVRESRKRTMSLARREFAKQRGRGRPLGQKAERTALSNCGVG